MAFDPIMMSQLGKQQPKLCDEIAQLLAGTESLNVQELFRQSVVAVTSRDISLELVQMKKSGLVDVVEYRRRPGFRQVGQWALTENGRAKYSEILEKVSRKAA